MNFDLFFLFCCTLIADRTRSSSPVNSARYIPVWNLFRSKINLRIQRSFFLKNAHSANMFSEIAVWADHCCIIAVVGCYSNKERRAGRENRGTRNKERKTENEEWKTENGKRRTGNGGTGPKLLLNPLMTMGSKGSEHQIWANPLRTRMLQPSAWTKNEVFSMVF